MGPQGSWEYWWVRKGKECRLSDGFQKRSSHWYQPVKCSTMCIRLAVENTISSKHICRPEFAFSIIPESVRVAVFCFCVLYRMQTKEPIGLGMRLHLPQTDTYDCLSVKLSTIISIFGHLGCVLGSVTHQKFKECFWIVEAWSWSLVHQAKARLAGRTLVDLTALSGGILLTEGF